MSANEAHQQKEAYYGLPKEVIFCRKCVMSNQRPASTPEFTHNKLSKKVTMQIEDGICDACRYAEVKATIDWEKREEELARLLDRYRSKNQSYDCIVSGSGGKDSSITSHMLKYKYGMNPLTVTFPPILYTDYGYKNFKNWLDIGGFDNISFTRNGKVMRTLTKLAIENLLHPFQTFILGQKNLAPKIASKFEIPLVFYGENEAEYGNPIADNSTSIRDNSFYITENIDKLYLGGVSVPELQEKYGIKKSDLLCFLPATPEELGKVDVQVHYFGYYHKWIPQEAYYYAVENTGFQARPFRSEGTYSKYASMDDKIDDIHYYTTYIKFGLGRATYDAAQEIRNGHLTREEGVALVNKFDGEFPQRYFEEVMKYLEIKPDDFLKLCDNFRSPHLWKKEGQDWKLIHQISDPSS